MEEALTALLLGDAPLTALIADRVHWLRVPPGVTGRPYLNLQVVSDPESYHMGGRNLLRQTLVQCDVWAETYASMKAVDRALRDLVSGYRDTFEGVEFQGIFVIASRESNAETTGAEDQLFRISVDIEISWKMEN